MTNKMSKNEFAAVSMKQAVDGILFPGGELMQLPECHLNIIPDQPVVVQRLSSMPHIETSRHDIRRLNIHTNPGSVLRSKPVS
jgi:hypothetical protein